MDPQQLQQLMAALSLRGGGQQAPGMPAPGVAAPPQVPAVPPAPQVPQMPVGAMQMPGRSAPGLMSSSSPQLPPMSGTGPTGGPPFQGRPQLPAMPGDSALRRASQEPTGDDPQRPHPRAAFPAIPRNAMGALLMPQTVGGNMAQPSATDFASIMQQFLRPSGG